MEKNNKKLNNSHCKLIIETNSNDKSLKLIKLYFLQKSFSKSDQNQKFIIRWWIKNNFTLIIKRFKSALIIALIINKMLGGYNYLDLNLNKISKRVFIIENVKAQCDISNYNTGFTAN